MAHAYKPKSAVHDSLADPRTKAAWRKAAWRDEGDEDQLRAAAQTVESLNMILAKFHKEEEQQDLSGYLWAL